MSMQLLRHLLRPESSRDWYTVILLMAFISALPAAVLTWKIAPDFVTRDVWRFLDTIRNFRAGDFSFQDLWGTHSSHRTPAYKGLFLLNAELFGLDMRLENLLGFLVHAITAIAITAHVVNTIPSSAIRWRWLAVIMIAVLWFSTGQSYFYTYSLLAISAGFSALFLVISLILLSRYLETGDRNQLAWSCAIWTSNLFLFGSGKTPAMIVALLSALALHMITCRTIRRRLLLVAGLFVFVTLLQQLIYWYGLDTDSTRHLSRRSMLEHPIEAITFITAGIGSAVFDAGVFRPHDISTKTWALTTGILIYVTAIMSIMLFHNARDSRPASSGNYLAASTLALYGFAFTGSVAAARLGIGELLATSPRYAHEIRFMFIGCFILLLQLASRRNWGMPVGVALVCVTLVVEAANMEAAYRIAPYRENNQQAARQWIIDVADGKPAYKPPSWLCPTPDICIEGIRYLEQEKLSLFRESASTRSER